MSLLRHHQLLIGRRVALDPYWSNVSLLLHFDGGDGSATFVDSGPLSLAVTRGSPAVQRATPARFGPSSLDATGNGGFARVSSNTPFQFGSGDFTVEAWVYPNEAAGADTSIVCKWANGGQLGWYMARDSLGRLAFYYSTNGTTGVFPGASIGMATGSWSHVAVARQGANLRFFINGVLGGTHNIGTASIFNSAAPLTVSNDSQSPLLNQRFRGAIDDLRITKGVARYTAAFTPPDAPFPNG